VSATVLVAPAARHPAWRMPWWLPEERLVARHQTGRGRAWEALCGVNATTPQESLPPSVGGIREGTNTRADGCPPGGYGYGQEDIEADC
jgi:hypothetical protein